MLSQKEIASIRTVLLSDRITYKGSEVTGLYQLLGALQREENALRLTPQPQTPAAPETPK